MDSTPMPEALRLAVHQLVAEAVMNCQEVLRYTEPDVAWNWKRMTQYRAADAADTMDMASMLISAYLEHMGMDQAAIREYMQVKYQKIRADGPRAADQASVAGLLSESAPEDRGLESMRFVRGQLSAEEARSGEVDPEKLFTAACLHGLRARMCEDVEALDSYLPPEVAEVARKVAEVLEMPQPADA